MEEKKHTKGWILYDGACGFCSKWVLSLEKLLNHYGYEIAPLQEEWVSERLQMSPEELTKDIRLLLAANNQLISGSDAYLYVMKRIWWLWPLALVFSLPGFHWVFNKAYQIFNRNRFLVSKACGLPGHVHHPKNSN